MEKLSDKFVALEKEQRETITKAEFEKVLRIVNNKIDKILSQQRTGMNRDTKVLNLKDLKEVRDKRNRLL